MTDVFQQHADCENPRVLLIEGDPAIGKTIFCEKLAHDWSLNRIPEDSSFPKVEILLLLKCRDMNKGIANIQEAIADQLLPKDVDRSEKENFFQFIRACQSRILLLLDGLDELKNKDLVHAVIQGKELSNIYLLLTTRTEMGANVRRYCDSLLQIVGYTEDDVNSYIGRYFRYHSDPSLAIKLKNKLDDHDELKELTYSPMNTALLCLLCEETNGIFPTKQTQLYECLVSCAIKRYFERTGDALPGDNPSKGCREQLNRLGKMALEALLEGRHYFSQEEMKSEDFLQLFFVTREPSRSKMEPTQCYAFAHRTFQEYFAALYLTNQVLADSKDAKALLLKLDPTVEWQVWKFLFPLVARKDGEKALFLVSCLGLSTDLAIHEAHYGVRSRTFKDTFHELFFCWDFESFRGPEATYSSVVRRVFEAIAACEDYGEKLSEWQRKMLVKLAECIPIDKLFLVLKSPHYLLPVSEYLGASSKLTKLGLEADCHDLSKLGHVLRSLHKLVVFELSSSDYPSSVGTFQSIPIDSIDSQLSEEDILVILDDKCTSCPITHLRLNTKGITDRGAKSLATALERRNVTFTHLTLNDTSITTAGFNALAEALRTNCVLTHLDLRDNVIRDEVAVALSEALQVNATLTHLSLEGGWEIEFKQLIGPSAASALAKALTINRTLKCLILGFNSIRDPGALAFADALRTNSTLTHLDLSSNGIGNSGTEAICKALQFNHVVTHLALGRNTIGDSGVEALARALEWPDTQLSFLHLVGCKITSIGVEALARALRTNRSLEHLNLGGTNVARSATALAETLQSNQTLAYLDLHDNNIESTAAIQLAQTLQDKNYTLAYLNLSRNRINAKGEAKLKLVDEKRCVIVLRNQEVDFS